MNQISETGHAMNMINFQSLLTFIDSLGDLYNPSRECIKRESLQTLLDNTQESFNSLRIRFIFIKPCSASQRLYKSINDSMKFNPFNIASDKLP